MYVVVGQRPYTTNVSSISFNTSETVAFLDARNISGGTYPHRAEVWRLIAPSATTASVVVNFDATADQAAVLVICRDDTDQTTPNDAVSKGGNLGATSASIPTAFTWGGGSDVQFMCMVDRSAGSTFTPDAGVTNVASVSNGVRPRLLTDTDTETGKVLGSFSASSAYNVFWFNVNEVSAGGSAIAPISTGYMLRGMR